MGSRCCLCVCLCIPLIVAKLKKNSVAFGPRANYADRADRATAASWRSSANFFADRGCCVVSATDPSGR
jgi:hypothetical protein